MTTDLMLRGFESRTIRQPPPAPCATGVCGTRETTTDRRLAGGSFLFFPPASAVCRSVQAFDWRRAWAIRGTAMAIAAGASASGGCTCGPTATSAIGPIDYELKAPHPYSFVVDETIALARGGTLTHDNSGPAHRWCNAIKGTHSLAWARERVAQLIAQGKAPQRIAPVSAGPIRCSDWFGGGE